MSTLEKWKSRNEIHRKDAQKKAEDEMEESGHKGHREDESEGVEEKYKEYTDCRRHAEETKRNG